jgi:hypothetical protein
MNQQKLFRVAVCMATLVCIIGVASQAVADWQEIVKPWELYGKVWNTSDGTPTGNPVGWCAPTATINSFIYLENKYPSIYDGLLTPGTDLEARNALRDYMGGCAQGATPQQWWEGKVKYIEDYAPGTTVFEGMVYWDPMGWYRQEDLVWGYPTWDFMWEQLSKCQDVEIGIYPLYEEEGHALTLTSMHFDDTNGNLQWDPMLETAAIDYLDPNNPTQVFWANVGLNTVENRLQFMWYNGGYNPQQTVYIGLAFAESVPEPAAIILLSLSGLMIVLKRRNR